MHILGLGHYSRAGKDTFARRLKEAIQQRDPEFRVKIVSFAGKVKAVAYDLYGWAGLQDEDHYNDPQYEHERDMQLPDLDKTPVDVWVALGVHAVRDCVDTDT